MKKNNANVRRLARYYSEHGGVYAIICEQNNKVYIGHSKNYKHRWNSHKSRLRRGMHTNQDLQKDYNKYGIDAFSLKVIQEYPPREDTTVMLQKEHDVIQKCLERNINLYNKMNISLYSTLTREEKSAKINLLRKEREMNSNTYREMTLMQLSQYATENKLPPDFKVKLDVVSLFEAQVANLGKQSEKNSEVKIAPTNINTNKNNMIYLSTSQLAESLDCSEKCLPNLRLEGIKKTGRGSWTINMDASWVKRYGISADSFKNPGRVFCRTKDAVKKLGLEENSKYTVVEQLDSNKLQSLSISAKNRRFLVSSVESVSNSRQAAQPSFDWSF